jgi:hypothetical protein
LSLLRRPEPWVFLILLGSYAFFWQARDWNSASRLMLTYALVDRGTIAINGLEDQTGDKAFFRGRYYTDKLPGFSFLAAGPYAMARVALRLPAHPLNRKGFAYWPADYWVTLSTSGLLTALTGVVLTGLARDLGCGPRRAALVGLAYGLTTPAYAYATMSYGHQASAFALLTAFALLWRTEGRRSTLRLVLAGFLASYAAVIELQVGPVSAILGVYLLAQVVGKRRPLSALGDFAVGAVVPALMLLGYNQLAFGSPWDMGYFHHATWIFSRVHSAENPLGLRSPHWERAVDLLWGGKRGLLFYAPILILALPGWVVLARRRLWGMAAVSLAVVASVFVVNLSYPEWTGGWSTGPRLLVPMLPFAMLPVAALLAAGGRETAWLAAVLALAGGVVILLFLGIGGRVPQDIPDPLREAVGPLWRGDPLPPWTYGRRFTRNAVDWLAPATVARLPERWRGLQFLPLALGQALVIAAMLLALRPAKDPRGPVFW